MWVRPLIYRPPSVLVAVLVLVTASTTVDAADRYQMRSAVSARLRAAQRIAAAGAEDTLPMAIALHLQHEDELQALLAAQQRPGVARVPPVADARGIHATLCTAGGGVRCRVGLAAR